MLEYTQVNADNLSEALNIQGIIFPYEQDEESISAAILKTGIEQDKPYDLFKMWIVGNSGVNIGITGLYSYKDYPQDVWLNWFGLLPVGRGRGFSKNILDWTIDVAKKMNRFDNFRLYTEVGDNDRAIEVYRRYGLAEEKYTAEKEVKNYLVFSKPLKSCAAINPWGDRPLHIYDEICSFNLQNKR